MMLKQILVGLTSCALASAAIAQEQTGSMAPTEGDALGMRLSLLGQVVPRSAAEIDANSWSVGTEAIDRDYSSYEAWRAYLGPLGAKRARLQSGWTRTDLGGGRYDFAWLDPIVDGMLSDKVQPWLSLSYGNDRYTGGGTGRRDSPLPSGAGRVAWLAYVDAVARRYAGRVPEYELWNEPDLNPLINAQAYGDFAFETARAIRAADPSAQIILGAFAGAWHKDGKERAFALASLKRYIERGGKAEALTYHSYATNPDSVYPDVETFIAAVKALSPDTQVRQGENGAPSMNQASYALRNMWWTEQSQAKWLLRRMLGDAARSIPTSMFSLTEMHYPPSAEMGLTWQKARGETRMIATAKHFKGMLETRRYAPGTPEDDRTVVRTKMAYVAMQALTAIFDSRLQPLAVKCTVTGTDAPVAVYAFRRADGASIIAAWRNGDRPDDSPVHEAVDIECPGLRFGEGPRYVDLLTRGVYATSGVVEQRGDSVTLRALPIYDSPVLVADAALVSAQ